MPMMREFIDYDYIDNDEAELEYQGYDRDDDNPGGVYEYSGAGTEWIADDGNEDKETQWGYEDDLAGTRDGGLPDDEDSDDGDADPNDPDGDDPDEENGIENAEAEYGEAVLNGRTYDDPRQYNLAAYRMDISQYAQLDGDGIRYRVPLRKYYKYYEIVTKPQYRNLCKK